MHILMYLTVVGAEIRPISTVILLKNRTSLVAIFFFGRLPSIMKVKAGLHSDISISISSVNRE